MRVRSFPGTPCLHNSLLSLEYFIESFVFSSNLVHLEQIVTFSALDSRVDNLRGIPTR